jgi:arylsulfatase A-like enzyme
VTFANAYAASPWTVPSHASIFTGLLPSAHGCTGHNHRFTCPQPTIAERLLGAGYETSAFYSNPWLADRTTGLLRGFARKYEAPIGGMHELRSPIGDQGGRNILGHFDRWLAERDRGRPFFAFVNFLEAHLAYDPPPDYRQRHLTDLAPNDAVTIAWGHEFNAGLHPTEFVEWERIRRLYGGDVNTADRLLDGLLQLLKRQGLYDDTVVIVTSDHGENLGDHGLFEHQFSVHESVLAVPLVIRPPARGLDGRYFWSEEEDVGTRAVGQTPLTLLYNTLLDLAALYERPLGAMHASLLMPPRHRRVEDVVIVENGWRYHVAEYEGPSAGLLGLLRGMNPGLDTAQLARAYRTVRDERYRLTVASDGARWLHDLRDDPGQLRNVLENHPSVAADLDSALTAAVGGKTFSALGVPEPGLPAGTAPIDEATRQQLRSLGYIR